MRDFVLEKMLDKLGMPNEVRRIFSSGKKYIIPNSREELMELAKNDSEKFANFFNLSFCINKLHF